MSPIRSVAQFGAMKSAAQGNSALGIPQSAATDFLAATPSPKGLPARAGPAPAPAAKAPPKKAAKGHGKKCKGKRKMHPKMMAHQFQKGAGKGPKMKPSTPSGKGPKGRGGAPLW